MTTSGRRQAFSTILVATAVVLGVGLGAPGAASASPPAPAAPPPPPAPPPPACVGVNELRYVDVNVFFLKLDSCAAHNLAENLDGGQKGAGVVTGLASKVPEAGIVGAALTAGLWYNQSAVEDCVAAAPGRGISFGVATGFVVRCRPQ